MILTTKCTRLLKTVRKVKSIQNNIHASCVTSAKSVDSYQPKFSEPAEESKEKQKGPFIKNLFAGIFDSEMLVYPEYAGQDELKAVVNRVRPVQEFFTHVNDPALIDKNAEIPKEVMDFLKENNVFSLRVPKQLNGPGVDEKEYAKFFESIGSDKSVTALLTTHNRVMNALLAYGNSIQTSKYIPKLSSGEWTSSFAIVEKVSGLNMNDIKVSATPVGDKSWSLNGKKIWVANGDKADFYLVFAKTWSGDISPDLLLQSTVFIVDKNSPGITCSPNLEVAGARGVSICDVVFENTIVSEDNILGEPGLGYDIAVHCFSKGRLASGASTAGLMKTLLEMVTEYVIHTESSGKTLKDFELYQHKLGKIATEIYAMESMAYLTAGIVDSYDDPDIVLEELAVNIFSLEKSLEIINLCSDMVGGQAFIKKSPLERFVRESKAYLLHDIIPVDVSKIYIASLAIQHVGKTLQEAVRKSRNPLEFPGFLVKNLFKFENAMKEAPKLPGKLKLQVHPSLGPYADKIEHCVLRFEYIVKDIMRRWGKQTLDKQIDLIGLVDCAISIYAMTAVLGRVSRSYCIGLQHSQFDALLANTFITIHHKRVIDITDKIRSGAYDCGDAGFLNIGQEIIKFKGYFFQHPLERNY